ncbi:hypothetical protein [Desulfitobacterium metallireducens]|uniref:DUF883 domain-containing protein n=1 Tax=Desulfitobacterium metallireducens DSM 15288 TaxID=871968 RepID=W0ED93_9FIRM|nr:hypothetical protein [Desulfitobacterium metallireducens]AHF07051.1 hypothetical protein DESME_08195 [Desulfitobacterium metallireducens DSM 15288]
MQDYYYDNDTTTKSKAIDLDLVKDVALLVKDAALIVIDLGYEFTKEVAQKPLAKGEEAIEKIGEKGKEAVDKGVETAKQHPLMTLLAAFGLGFLVVKLLKRK